jgi:hypothetical protein
MQSQFDVTSLPPARANAPASAAPTELSDLLRQMLEVQREQLVHLKATAAAHDAGARWRQLMARWKQEFPELPAACKQALPILERAYGTIIAALVEELRGNGDDALDNDFALQDFLDRFGMRLGQLGNIINLVGPLAEAGSQSESSGNG